MTRKKGDYKSRPLAKAGKCAVCRHSKVLEINTHLLDPHGMKLEDLVNKYNAEGEPIIATSSLSRHRKLHLKGRSTLVRTDDGTEIIVVPQNSELFTSKLFEKYVKKPPSETEFLEAVVAAAFTTVKSNPGSVSIKDAIEALKLLKALGGSAGSIEDANTALQNVMARRKFRSKRVTVITETAESPDTEIIDVSPIE